MPQIAGNSTELTLSIVHDLRNPLSAICGCAELLDAANLDPEQTRRVASNIRRASEQMKNLLTAIVSVATPSFAKSGPVSLVSLPPMHVPVQVRGSWRIRAFG